MKNLFNGWAPGSAMNMQYLSVRDIKLLYAEALADAGQLSEAMTQVNDVRRRAALDVNIIKLENGQAAANYKVAEYLHLMRLSQAKMFVSKRSVWSVSLSWRWKVSVGSTWFVGVVM